MTPHYVTANAALHGLCRALAWDAGADGVLTNVVAMGFTRTDRNQERFPAELFERAGALTPQRRTSTTEDGARLGLKGMIADMMRLADADLTKDAPADLVSLAGGDRNALARIITALEADTLRRPLVESLRERSRAITVPLLGVTGTGGSGKSSLARAGARSRRA